VSYNGTGPLSSPAVRVRDYILRDQQAKYIALCMPSAVDVVKRRSTRAGHLTQIGSHYTTKAYKQAGIPVSRGTLEVLAALQKYQGNTLYV
jgi:hypothetical protein